MATPSQLGDANMGQLPARFADVLCRGGPTMVVAIASNADKTKFGVLLPIPVDRQADQGPPLRFTVVGRSRRGCGCGCGNLARLQRLRPLDADRRCIVPSMPVGAEFTTHGGQDLHHALEFTRFIEEIVRAQSHATGTQFEHRAVGQHHHDATRTAALELFDQPVAGVIAELQVEHDRVGCELVKEQLRARHCA